MMCVLYYGQVIYINLLRVYFKMSTICQYLVFDPPKLKRNPSRDGKWQIAVHVFVPGHLKVYLLKYSNTKSERGILCPIHLV
jgi:hypothetical protein